MTYRDPAPETPACPICDSSERVQRHEDPYQGRFLCMGCMLLFDGVSAEWLRPSRQPLDVDAVRRARAALRQAVEGAPGGA